MSEELRRPYPERLAHDLELGSLLEQASVEYAAGLDEARAFQRVAERLLPPVRRGRWRRVGAGLVASLAGAGLALVVAALIVFERSSAGIVVGPEASAWPAKEPAALASAAREVAVPQQVESSRPAVSSEQQSSSAPPRAASEKREKAHSVSQAPVRHESAAPAEPGVQEDCLALARRGQAQEAERCFGARAAGSGLGAEMALYEMARLRRDVLRDAPGALAVLGEYRERFPRGSLRNEVDLSRVELLALLGRGAEALQESAALLASATGRERGAELHLLRGNVYRHDLGDLRAAAGEYAQVEAEGGARGAQAAALRAACLEGLKDRGQTP